jgi:predicted small lipoprotein YifL
MIRVLMIALALAPLLAACGTKGDLECPRGTVAQPNGTCAPPAKLTR